MIELSFKTTSILGPLYAVAAAGLIRSVHFPIVSPSL